MWHRYWHLADITNRAEPCLLSGVKRTSADPSEMSGYSLERTFCAIGDGLIADDGTAVAFDPNVKRLGKFAMFKARSTNQLSAVRSPDRSHGHPL
jgi:hypothetical protein